MVGTNNTAHGAGTAAAGSKAHERDARGFLASVGCFRLLPADFMRTPLPRLVVSISAMKIHISETLYAWRQGISRENREKLPCWRNTSNAISVWKPASFCIILALLQCTIREVLPTCVKSFGKVAEPPREAASQILTSYSYAFWYLQYTYKTTV